MNDSPSMVQPGLSVVSPVSSCSSFASSFCVPSSSKGGGSVVEVHKSTGTNLQY